MQLPFLEKMCFYILSLVKHIITREKLKLVQAKGKYNSHPSEDISDMIVQYSQERGILIDTYDINIDEVAS